MRTHKGLLSSAGRSVVMATIAVLAVTIGEPRLAIAGSAVPASKGVTVTTASSDATDFSAARRRHRHYRRGGGDAAGLAFFGMALGTIGAIVAQQNYGYGYGYGYGPGYYGGGPYYYGGGPYYGGPYYGRRYYYRPF
jgi:hypothetical protein